MTQALKRTTTRSSPVRRDRSGVSRPSTEVGALSQLKLIGAAVLSLVSALIHLWTMPGHFVVWWGYGSFFLLVGFAQAILSGVLLYQPRRPLLMLGLGGNLAVIGFYLVTRLNGIPFFGPHAGYRESVGVLDIVATVTELALVIVLLPIVPGLNQARVARGTLALAVVATLGIGVWATIAPQIGVDPIVSARLGEPVAVSGGFLRVDRITPESMAPMNADKFAGSGMSMSGMGMDMAPKGYRRFTAEVTLVGQASNGLPFSAEQFQLVAPGLAPVGPHRSNLPAGVVPRGSAVSGTLVFQVPETARELALRFGDARQMIALDLGASPEHGGHAHASATPSR